MGFTLSRWTKKLRAARKRRRDASAHIRLDQAAIEQARRDAAYAQRVLKRHAQEAPAHQALKIAASYIGVKEHPPGSNSGPLITEWLQAVHCPPAPWCGAFMYHVLAKAGVKGLSDRMRYTPWIVDDGRAGRNGLAKIVPWVDRKPGDLLLYNWDSGMVDHVGMYEGEAPGAGNVTAIEGNTAVGNESNGGQVMRRVRNRAFVQYVVRPEWP